MDAVAVRARHFVQLVLARRPKREIAVARVAGEADRRPFVGRVALAERVGRLGLARILQVLGRVAVAVLAHAAVGVVFAPCAVRSIACHCDS